EVENDGEGSAPPLPEDDFHSDFPGNRASKKLGEFTDNISSSGTCTCALSRADGACFGEGDVETMCHHLSVNPGEYSYFSPRTLSMWAGPQHWRFKPRHTSNANSEKETRKRNVKEVFELNFDENVDFEAYFCKTKASVTLAKSILERENVRSTTLPEDFNYNPENFPQLFLKPLVKLNRTSEPVTALENEAEIEDYDYNNPNDTSNFCPALQVLDSDNDNDPSEFLAQTGALSPQGLQLSRVLDRMDVTMYGELNLIAEPQKINKIAIQYAKNAEKTDMRRLKEATWQLLTDGQKKWTVGEAEDAEKEEDTSVVAGERKLSDIMKDLRHRLPADMATNLSVPSAFVCLLHLASEKNLNLEGTEDMSDVLVTQDT
ncbi:CND2 protein, partial [Tachuris rubrigastra]|nr:CND2 protein [Tachuris rubrigastra]